MSTDAQNSSRLYRVAYESFSQFSNKINRCSNLEEVGTVVRHHLKYFLNFRVIRIAVEQNEKFLFFALIGDEVWYDLKSATALLPYEQQLYKNEIPIRTENFPEELLEQKLRKKDLKGPVLWGWSINKNNRKLLVSLLADEVKPFSSGDIEILKLAVDSFEA
ncbi:MAG: histidine kinase, partial [Salegentibacter sp.]